MTKFPKSLTGSQPTILFHYTPGENSVKVLLRISIWKFTQISNILFAPVQIVRERNVSLAKMGVSPIFQISFLGNFKLFWTFFRQKAGIFSQKSPWLEGHSPTEKQSCFSQYAVETRHFHAESEDGRIFIKKSLRLCR